MLVISILNMIPIPGSLEEGYHQHSTLYPARKKKEVVCYKQNFDANCQPKGKLYMSLYLQEQQSPTFLILGTGFVEDNFSTDCGGDGFGMVSV